MRRLATLFCLILASSASARPGVSNPQTSAPLFHGNWCGVGDADRASPVDALDAACRAHDLCYEQAGRGACICDRALLKATAALIRSPAVQESVRSKAATVNSLFSAVLCREDGKNTHPRRKR
nr:phospholipase A2 family protein [Microvirga solisilvae]